ncbi:lysozyme-like [Copidosoma floridanum]|uniref:lysozyme-like n=1 Tax=Copidosoma floridanum TaxID=29053 RepID=UPI0006C98A17|nr:lysozyme-like [Copidosoma floridanum]
MSLLSIKISVKSVSSDTRFFLLFSSSRTCTSMGLKSLSFALALLLAAAFVYGEEQGEITQACLGCICDAASGCNTTIGCTGDVCGPFRITKIYWTDGGKPSIDGESDGDDSGLVISLFIVYKNNHDEILKNIVQWDCNGDGTIDCNDYARIHHLGGFGCTGALDETYENTFTYCHNIFKEA